ncbi:hypothetical protein D3C72_2294380 [compost metagenome]
MGKHRQRQPPESNLLKYRIGDNKINGVEAASGRIAGASGYQSVDELNNETQRQYGKKIMRQAVDIIVLNEQTGGNKQSPPIINGESYVDLAA